VIACHFVDEPPLALDKDTLATFVQRWLEFLLARRSRV
jgi:hypothetical protein